MSKEYSQPDPTLVEGQTTVEWSDSYRAEVINAFEKLKGIQNPSAAVRQLQAEALVIPERLNTLRETAGMPRGIAELCLDNVPASDMTQCFEEAILDIATHTTYFNELHETQIIPALMLGNLRKGKFKSKVAWHPPHTKRGKELDKEDTAGEFISTDNQINIAGHPPTPREIWFNLVTRGILPDGIATLDHELVHKEQYPQPAIFYWLKEDETNEMLLEIHAFAAEAGSPTSSNYTLNEGREVGSFVEDVYNQDYPAGVSERAFNQIQILRMLGYNDAQLAAITRQAQYDEDTKAYSLLLQSIKNKLEALEIGKQDTITYLRALKVSHDVNLQYQRHCAMQIAATHLKKFGNNRTWDEITTLPHS